MLRRDPPAILAAHDLDPDRRTLYVEGRADRAFLVWLSEGRRDGNVVIAEIESVDIDVAAGGNRARVIALCTLVAGETDRIRGLVDADNDRILDREVPPNVWMTDFRDLEGYVLNDDCLRRVWCLALGKPDADPSEVLRNAMSEARRLGLLRLYSDEAGLDLPFKNTNLRKHVKCPDGSAELEFHTALAALMKNADISLNEFEAIADAVDELDRRFLGEEDNQIAHGKDAFMIIAELMHEEEKVTRAEADRILWTSFERDRVDGYPILQDVLDFLAA